MSEVLCGCIYNRYVQVKRRMDMLQYIIDAYKQEEGQKQFYKSLKNMDIISKICLTLLVVLCGFMLVSMLIPNIKWFVISFISIGIIMFMYIGFSVRMRRKKWVDNIGEYNDSLDRLKEILCNASINYYNKKKITKLIEQCKDEISSLIAEKIRSKEDKFKYIQIIIIPIFSFVAGSMTRDMDRLYEIALSITLFIIVIIISLCSKGLEILLDDLSGGLVEERKFICEKLQDLLIRDFKI